MSNQGLIFVRKMANKTILLAIIDTEAVQKLQTESQHFVTIQTGIHITTVSILHKTYRDRTEETKGNNVSDILSLPIWQN